MVQGNVIVGGIKLETPEYLDDSVLMWQSGVVVGEREQEVDWIGVGANLVGVCSSVVFE